MKGVNDAILSVCLLFGMLIATIVIFVLGNSYKEPEPEINTKSEMPISDEVATKGTKSKKSNFL